MKRLAASIACALAALAGAAERDEIAGQVSQDRLMRTVRELPEQRAANGRGIEQVGLRATEDLLMQRVRELGYEPELQPVPWAPRSRSVAPPDEPWNNIVFELPGTEKPEEVVLIGAHFDAVPGSPGADDNGTGVAGLLEIARLLKDHPRPRTIAFALYNLEEVGLVGARRHAGPFLEAIDAEGGTLVCMLSLEMLGYYSDEPGSQRSPVPAIPGVFEPPTVGNTIVLASTRVFQPVTRALEDSMMGFAASDQGAAFACPPVFRFDVAAVPVPDILRSDHAPYLLAGRPAVMVTDTSNFRNPHYHTPQDTADSLDAERFAGAVAMITAAVWDQATNASTTAE